VGTKMNKGKIYNGNNVDIINMVHLSKTNRETLQISLGLSGFQGIGDQFADEIVLELDPEIAIRLATAILEAKECTTYSWDI
jgi:hypothetical protein